MHRRLHSLPVKEADRRGKRRRARQKNRFSPFFVFLFVFDFNVSSARKNRMPYTADRNKTNTKYSHSDGGKIPIRPRVDSPFYFLIIFYIVSSCFSKIVSLVVVRFTENNRIFNGVVQF